MGKVRHTYDLPDGNKLLVASDRVSTYDCVHPTAIPGKGKILTQMAAFWFKFAENLGMQHHLLTADHEEIISRYPELAAHREQLAGRSMLAKNLHIIPVEAVARGNLAGSGVKDYHKNGAVCGIPLPPGLLVGSPLPQAIFTPATKAEEGHDQNISFEEAVQHVGKRGREIMLEMRHRTLELFEAARAYADERGIILADTKLEWGYPAELGEDTSDASLVLADEVLTPDSSRFWPKDGHQPGVEPKSFDKQYVRNHVSGLGWNKKDPAPSLPSEVVSETQGRYAEAFERLTGKSWKW